MFAPGRLSLSRTTGARPRFGSKIVRQVIAVTTVRIAHGTSTTVRRMARPLNAWCIASAIPSPMTSSSVTAMTVNRNVVLVAIQNSDDLSAAV